jgi:hypothetical protein
MSDHQRPHEEENNKRGKKREPGKNLVPSTTGSGGKVPAKRPNPIANFLAFTDRCDEQIKIYQELCTKYHQRNYRVDLYREGDVAGLQWLSEQVCEGAEQCTAQMKQLWPSLDEDEILHPSVEYLMLRITHMITSWPNVKLAEEAGEHYVERLAERLDIEGLSVPAWESVFRELEDTFKGNKAPVAADVLPLVGSFKRKWEKRLEAINVKHVQLVAENVIFAAEFKQSVFVDAVLEYLECHG